jgi:hypothetical protein
MRQLISQLVVNRRVIHPAHRLKSLCNSCTEGLVRGLACTAATAFGAGLPKHAQAVHVITTEQDLLQCGMYHGNINVVVAPNTTTTTTTAATAAATAAATTTTTTAATTANATACGVSSCCCIIE